MRTAAPILMFAVYAAAFLIFPIFFRNDSTVSHLQTVVLNPIICVGISLIITALSEYRAYYIAIMPIVFIIHFFLFLSPEWILILPIYIIYTAAGFLAGSAVRRVRRGARE